MNWTRWALVVIFALVVIPRSANAMLHPQQGRFMQRDPLGYVDGMNGYQYQQTDPFGVDPLGLWKEGPGGGSRRQYTSECNDGLVHLAGKVHLSVLAKQMNRWLQGGTLQFTDGGSVAVGSLVQKDVGRLLKPGQKVTVPNVWIAADILKGGGLWDWVINEGGGSVGILVGTDIFTNGKKVVKANSFSGLTGAVSANSGNIWGIVIFGHGDKDGTLVNADGIGGNQGRVIGGLAGQGFQVSKAYAMQCYSHFVGNYYGRYYDWRHEWEKVALDANGYVGLNALGIDWGD